MLILLRGEGIVGEREEDTFISTTRSGRGIGSRFADNVQR